MWLVSFSVYEVVPVAVDGAVPSSHLPSLVHHDVMVRMALVADDDDYGIGDDGVAVVNVVDDVGDDDYHCCCCCYRC